MDNACTECGFAYSLSEAEGAGSAITEACGELVAALSESGAELRSRREEKVWSPLEYACHVRDVLIVQRERVLLARREARPSLQAMGRDERVDHDGYAEQHPEDVARQLGDAARLFANVLGRLGPADWDRRTVMYNYPEPSERSLRWVAMHTLHEVRHHLLDIRRQT